MSKKITYFGILKKFSNVIQEMFKVHQLHMFFCNFFFFFVVLTFTIQLGIQRTVLRSPGKYKMKLI